MEFVNIIMKSHNETAATSLIGSWGNLPVMKGRSRMIAENNSPVGSSKSNGTVEKVIQMIKMLRISFEEKWKVKLEVVHSILPWIAAYAGFLLTRFEVGRDRKTAHEGLEGKSATVQGMMFAEGDVAREETSRKPTWNSRVHVEGWSLVGRRGNNR